MKAEWNSSQYLLFENQRNQPAIDLIPWQGWLAIAGLGVFATVLALALFQLGVFLCGSVKASLLSTFEPLTGVILGVLVFHETLTPRTVAGIALILLSALFLVMERKPGLSGGESR